MTYTVLLGDCRETLRTLPDQSAHCCVTSPPYFGLRDYGHEGQIGLEDTPDDFVQRLVEVFREVRRVLRDDGTVWLNLGDSYGSGKQLMGIPWRVAFALQADGWYLRQDIIWHKPNPMPESVRDRCTKAHEYIFLLSKSARYYFDANVIREVGSGRVPGNKVVQKIDKSRNDGGINGIYLAQQKPQNFRNKRSVWTVSTKPYKGAHFATFPPDLIEPCILAGCPEGGTVLDPFGGSGTTAGVAMAHGRNAILCELNPEYAALVGDRVKAIVSTMKDDQMKMDI